MRKAITILLALVMVLSLAACGGGNTTTEAPTPTETIDTPAPAETEAPATPELTEAVETPAETETPATPEPTPEPTLEIKAVPLSIGDKIENENFTMTFDSIEILPEFSYRTSTYSSTSLYVEDGYQIALLRGHFENTSTATISDSCFTFTFIVNDSFVKDGYDVRFNFMRDKYFEIDPYTDYDYCLYINIPEKLAEKFEKAVVSIGFNNDMSIPTTVWNSDGTKTTDTDNIYEFTSGIANADAPSEPISSGTDADDNSNYEIIEIGKTIKTEDYEFTLNNVELTYEVKPQNTSSVYTSYKADSGKVYIHIDGEYYNTSKRDVCIRDLPVATADYDDGYTYKGSAVVDKGDNSFTWASSYVVCTPLETCHYHCLIECPEVVDKSDAPLFFNIEIGNTSYRYDIR